MAAIEWKLVEMLVVWRLPALASQRDYMHINQGTVWMPGVYRIDGLASFLSPFP